MADGSNSGKGQTNVPKTVPFPKSSLFVQVLPPLDLLENIFLAKLF
jgi:hypothetical protein